MTLGLVASDQAVDGQCGCPRPAYCAAASLIKRGNHPRGKFSSDDLQDRSISPSCALRNGFRLLFPRLQLNAGELGKGSLVCTIGGGAVKRFASDYSSE